MLTGEAARWYQLLNGGTALCSDAFQDCWILLFVSFGLVTLSKQRSQVGCTVFCPRLLHTCKYVCVTTRVRVCNCSLCVWGGGGVGCGGVVDAIIVCVRGGGGR